jgi:hypothetical protein
MLYTIDVWHEPSAPPQYQYVACFGDYDLGVDTGHGPSAETAMIDLITNYELPKGEF